MKARTPRRGDRTAAIEEQRALVDEWVSRRARATTELAELQEKAGESVLDDHTAASAIVSRISALRDTIALSEQAIEAAEGRLLEAQRTALRVEVDRWLAEVQRRQAVLDAHEARTAELLAELLRHEGRFVCVQEADRLIGSIMMQPGQKSIVDGAPVLKSEPLRLAVEDARMKAAICQAVVGGKDPRAVAPDGRLSSEPWGQNRPLEPGEYPPEVWGPGAIMPAPRYLDASESARRQIANLDAELAAIPGQMAALEAFAAQQGRAAMPSENQPMPLTPGERQRLVSLAARLEAGPAERVRLEQQLSCLVG